MEAYLLRPNRIAVENIQREEKPGRELYDEDIILSVGTPLDCPFRQEEQCTLGIEPGDIIKPCSCSFVRPPNCPLRKVSILVEEA